MKLTGEVDSATIEAADYFISRLLDGRLHRHITVEIEYDYSQEYAGSTVNDDPEAKTPKYFTISMNPIFCGDGRKFEILAHELTHVAQYASGRLRDGDRNGVVYWLGERYGGVKSLDYGAWDEYPWEEEAYNMEEELLEDFLSREVE